MLNLDDLQSTLVPDQPTHVTILIPPTQSETDLKLGAQANSELRAQELVSTAPQVATETGTGTMKAGAGTMEAGTGTKKAGAGTVDAEAETMKAGAGTIEAGAGTRETEASGQGSKPDTPTHSRSHSQDLVLSDLASKTFSLLLQVTSVTLDLQKLTLSPVPIPATLVPIPIPAVPYCCRCS